MSKAFKSKKLAHRRDSQYEAVIQILEERGVLSTPVVHQSSTPEDLNSRSLFPHEPSREPTIYTAANIQKSNIS